MQGIFNVKRVGEKTYINSRSGGQTAMKRITLKEPGNEYADEFVVTVFGQAAEQPTYGNVVAAKLRFLVTEYQGKSYQEVSADELLTIS